MANSKRIILGADFANPRDQAKRNPYMEEQKVITMSEDVASEVPQSKEYKSALYSNQYINTKTAGVIRKGSASFSGPGGMATASGGSAQSIAQSPLYYDYRWSTPDKFYYPRNRVVANSIFREIYKRDAVVATATDMYAELPWSEFDIIGLDDSSIRKVYEDMFNAITLVPKLTPFTRDYLITGELIIHSIFNASRGIWEKTISHNPDYIRAESVGLLMDQPLLWLKPTPEIRRLLNSPDPRIKKLLKMLPKELVNAVKANKDIPLDEMNTTFIPRLANSTDARGSSLYTRLFRIVMYEDFVVNASLAVSQRMAAPLRMFKMGDPATGWLPSDDDLSSFGEMLSMAESDPMAAIITHKDVTCELVGVSDRALLISKEWDFLERSKLLALGVAKSFLVGESSFAASVAGLQVLLERLSSLRHRFETDFIIKKLMVPIAKMHDFYKRPKSELEHRIRVKNPEELEPLIPSLKWRKNLDPAEDPARLGIWRDLKERGILSDRTYASGSGVDLDVERKNQKEEKKYVEDNPEMFGIPESGAAFGAATPSGGGAGSGGAKLPPGKPPKSSPKIPTVPGVPGSTPLPDGTSHPVSNPPPSPFGSSKTSSKSDLKDEIIEALAFSSSAKNSSINIQDAVDIVEEHFEEHAKQERELEKVEQYFNASAGKNLLSGE